MLIASSRFACHDRLYFACEIPANVRFCHRISHQQGEIVPWWQGQHVCLIFCQNEIRRCGAVLLGLVLKKSSWSTLKKSWKRCSIRIWLLVVGLFPRKCSSPEAIIATYRSSSKPRNSVFSWPRQKDTTRVRLLMAHDSFNTLEFPYQKNHPVTFQWRTTVWLRGCFEVSSCGWLGQWRGRMGFQPLVSGLGCEKTPEYHDLYKWKHSKDLM